MKPETNKTHELTEALAKAIEKEQYADTASSEAVSDAHASLAEHLELQYTRQELELLQAQIAEVLTPEPK